MAILKSNKRAIHRETILALAPRAASRPDFRRFAAETEQEGASPGAALDVLEMNLRVDVRPLLGTVRAPTVLPPSLLA